jgi:hypothetical protein
MVSIIEALILFLKTASKIKNTEMLPANEYVSMAVRNLGVRIEMLAE